MTRIIKTCTAIILMFITLFVMAIFATLPTTKTNIKKAEILLGKEVVIHKDTLVLQDYSVWNNSFKLSNGTTLNATVVDKFLMDN